MTLPVIKGSRQPPFPRPIDRGNPLTRGLFFALVPIDAPPQTISTASVVNRIDQFGQPAEYWSYGGGGGRPTFVVPTRSASEWTFAAIGLPIDTTGFRVLASFYDSANPGTAIHSLYSRAYSSGNAGAYSGIYQTGSTNGATAWTAGTPAVTGVVFSGAANAGAFYFGRRKETSFALSATTACTVDRVEMATRQGSDASSAGNCVALLCGWNRALTDAEWQSFADDPWQIFVPSVRNLWMGVAGAQPDTLWAQACL